MNNQTTDRLNFIELLNQEFLSHTGYGAYAYLSTHDAITLFDEFAKQKKPAGSFIKSFVHNFDHQ